MIKPAPALILGRYPLFKILALLSLIFSKFSKILIFKLFSSVMIVAYLRFNTSWALTCKDSKEVTIIKIL